jgi:hypothetical protein
LLFCLFITTVSTCVLADSDVASIKLLGSDSDCGTQEEYEGTCQKERNGRGVLLSVKGPYVGATKHRKAEGKILKVLTHLANYLIMHTCFNY